MKMADFFIVQLNGIVNSQFEYDGAVCVHIFVFVLYSLKSNSMKTCSRLRKDVDDEYAEKK